MALTLKAAITATQTTVDIAGSDTLFEGDVRSIDSEYVEIRSASQATLQYGETAYYRATIKRGVQGSAKATHAAAASLTAVLPGGGAGAVDSVNGATGVVILDAEDVGAAADDDARLSDTRTPTAHAASHQNGGADEIDVTGLTGAGGSGIPQGGPLTEPLDVSDQALTSAASGANTGASVSVAAATVDGGGSIQATAGEHPDGGGGASMGLFGAEDGAGGTGQFTGGNGVAGAAGGGFSFTAGSGDDGADAGAGIEIQAGDGEGNPGIARFTASGVQFDITGPLVHQGGPLTEDLDADNNKITGLAQPEDDNDAATKVYADVRTVRAAEGVPSGAPTGQEMYIAFDSTAVTGGVYYWTGAAWVKGGTI